MKAYTLLLLAALVALSLPSHSEALLKDSPSMRVVSEEVSPEPVEPGQDVTVKIRVYNDYVYGVPGYGNGSEGNATVSLGVNYPFYLKTGHNLDEPQICMGCSKDYAYYLAVDAGAVSGVYPLIVKVSRGAIEREYEINVKIAGIPDVAYGAEPIKTPAQAGSSFSVTASLKNIGTGAARNVKISTPSDKFVVLGAGQKIVEYLPPGNGSAVSLQYAVDGSVKTGSYSIPLELSYLDERGKTYSSSGTLGVKVENPAKLGIENLKTSPEAGFVAGTQAGIQMRVENMGDGDADNVRAILALPDSTNRVSYLGKLEPGDDAPAVFSYVPDAPGNYSYRITISYSDGYGEHSIEEKLPVQVIPKAGDNTSYMAAAAFIFLVAAAGLFMRKK